MSENILGTVFQNYKKRVAIGWHKPLTFSLLSRPSSLWLPILTRRLQTLKVASDKKVYVQRDPALRHFTLNGRTEVLFKSFWGQISGTFLLKNLKNKTDWEKDHMQKGRVTHWCHFSIPHSTPLITSGSSWTSIVVSNDCGMYFFSFLFL